jgi:hypothetical protein
MIFSMGQDSLPLLASIFIHVCAVLALLLLRLMQLAAQPEEIFSTFHVVADLDSEAGIRFVKEALEFVPDSKSRVTFVHNPANVGELPAPEQAPSSWLFSHLISKNLLSKQSKTAILRALGISQTETDEKSQKPLSATEYFSLATGGLALRDLDSDKYADYVEASTQLSRDLKLAPGSNGLIVNGRVSICIRNILCI